MTDRNKQFKSIMMTTLVVLSVFAGVVITSGTAMAAENSRSDTNDGVGTFDTTAGDGFVLPGAIVFQGESAQFSDNGSVGFTSDTLLGTSGSAEGIPLTFDIPANQQVGTYEDDAGNSVTVLSPDITEFEVFNEQDVEVESRTISRDEQVTVVARWNYEEAEDLELTVEDDGLDVTNTVLVGESATRGESDIVSGGEYDGYVTYELSFEERDVGDYDLTLEGVDDLNFGDATQTITLGVGTNQNTDIALDSSEATKGENVRFVVTDSVAGTTHNVTIEKSDLEENADVNALNNLFADVGDVVSTGDSANYVYATVEIDTESDEAVGEINTEYLDTGVLTLRVYPSDYTLADIDAVNNVNDETDSVDLSIVKGAISLTSPAGEYVIGSQTGIEGTASDNVDNVVFYARDNSNWEVLEIDGSYIHRVDGDGTFDLEDVRLSNGDGLGNSLVSIPGEYAIGVVDATVVEDVSDVSGVMTQIDTQQLSDSPYDYTYINTVRDTLSATFYTFNGQISHEDAQIDVAGTSDSQDSVLIVFVSDRGETVAEQVSVDSDGEFDTTDISLESLSQGTVEAFVLSADRDESFGDSSPPNGYTAGYSGMEEYITNLGTEGLTQDAIIESIMAETVDDTASDDVVVRDSFRLTSQRISIDEFPEAVSPGETLTISGTTNVDPDSNLIDITFNGEDTTDFQFTILNDWEDGSWEVTANMPEDLAYGEYSLIVDTGDAVDSERFIYTEVDDQEPTPEEPVTEEPVTEEPVTEEPVTEEPVTEEPATEEPTPEETSTDSTVPGFGVVVALVALIAVSLLAVRRNK